MTHEPRAESAVRWEIVFTGRVQGVGFRATTERIGRQFAVAGWVRNEPDGSVRLVAEGARGELERFLAALRSRMGGFIARERLDEQPARAEFDHFEVRR